MTSPLYKRPGTCIPYGGCSWDCSLDRDVSMKGSVYSSKYDI